MFPVFTPVLGRNPSGDRNATLAVFQALREISHETFRIGKAVEAHDGAQLKPPQALAGEAGRNAVLVMTGSILIGHMKHINAVKAATTHLCPAELAQRLGVRAGYRDVKADFGLDFFSCPLYALDFMTPPERALILDDPRVLATQTVPAFLPSLAAAQGESDPLFAGGQKIFALSLPGAYGPGQDWRAQEFLAGLAVQKRAEGYRILVISNPRSLDFLAALLALLPFLPDIAEDEGEFVTRVLPGLQANRQSLLYLPGDSASVQAEAMEALPAAQIIVNALDFIDHEHEFLARYFHGRMGRVSLWTAEGIKRPDRPPLPIQPAAAEIAAALVKRFATYFHRQ